MSLVIAIKDKNRIILGSDRQTSTAYNKDHSCTKIWAVPELEGAIMGGVGSMRASQIIQFSPVVDKNLLTKEGPTLDLMVSSLGPSIMATLEANGIVCEAEEKGACKMLPNAFIFAYKDKAWMIWNDLSVTEIDDYLAIGSGSDVAKGVLFATRDKTPFERIVTSIDAAADMTLFVDDGIDILTTKDLASDTQDLIKVLTPQIAAPEKTDKKVKKKAKKKETKNIPDKK